MLWATAGAEGEVRILWDRFGPAGGFVLLVVPRRCFCGGSFCFVSLCLKKKLCCWRLMYVFIFLIKLR